MKKLIKIKALIVLGVTLFFSASAQDNPQFYIDNGSKVVTEIDCANLKDLSVKIPITENMFKFDKIYINVNVWTKENNPTTNEVLVYDIAFNQKKFDILYKGKKEIFIWLVNLNNGDGDLVGQTLSGNINRETFCGTITKEKMWIS